MFYPHILRQKHCSVKSVRIFDNEWSLGRLKITRLSLLRPHGDIPPLPHCDSFSRLLKWGSRASLAHRANLQSDCYLTPSLHAWPISSLCYLVFLSPAWNVGLLYIFETFFFGPFLSIPSEHHISDWHRRIMIIVA